MFAFCTTKENARKNCNENWKKKKKKEKRRVGGFFLQDDNVRKIKMQNANINLDYQTNILYFGSSLNL